MNSLLLKKFIEKSTLVSNGNFFIKKEQINDLLNKEDFDFIALPSFNIYKDCTIDEKGINRSLIEADSAIAETGTVILKSKSEKIRLASSLCEELNILLKQNLILEKLEDAEMILKESVHNQSNYIAFITGASRTADIERVLTIGVHGPVRMNVYILED